MEWSFRAAQGDEESWGFDREASNQADGLTWNPVSPSGGSL